MWSNRLGDVPDCTDAPNRRHVVYMYFVDLREVFGMYKCAVRPCQLEYKSLSILLHTYRKTVKSFVHMSSADVKE